MERSDCDTVKLINGRVEGERRGVDPVFSSLSGKCGRITLGSALRCLASDATTSAFTRCQVDFRSILAEELTISSRARVCPFVIARSKNLKHFWKLMSPRADPRNPLKNGTFMESIKTRCEKFLSK